MRGRTLGVDVGERRIGLAVSDPSGTLARPLKTLTVAGPRDAIEQVVREVERLSLEDEGLDGIVVGVPAHLDGSPSEQTGRVLAFIEALSARTRLPIAQVDERLTSREAESRLARREKDWRRRKARLDAAAAAIILQEHLDSRSPAPRPERGDEIDSP